MQGDLGVFYIKMRNIRIKYNLFPKQDCTQMKWKLQHQPIFFPFPSPSQENEEIHPFYTACLWGY